MKKGSKPGFVEAADELRQRSDLKHSVRASPVQKTIAIKVTLSLLPECPWSLVPAVGVAQVRLWGRPVGHGSQVAPDVCWYFQHCASCQRRLVGCPGPSCLQQTLVTAVPLRPEGFVTGVTVPRTCKVLEASWEETLWGCSTDGKSAKKLIESSLQMGWGNGHCCR